MKEVLRKLITNNTGVSIKNYMLLWASVIFAVDLFIVLGFEWYLMLHAEVTYRPNYTGISLIITAFGSMFAALIYGKIKDNGYFNTDSHIE